MGNKFSLLFLIPILSNSSSTFAKRFVNSLVPFPITPYKILAFKKLGKPSSLFMILKWKAWISLAALSIDWFILVISSILVSPMNLIVKCIFSY